MCKRTARLLCLFAFFFFDAVVAIEQWTAEKVLGKLEDVNWSDNGLKEYARANAERLADRLTQNCVGLNQVDAGEKIAFQAQLLERQDRHQQQHRVVPESAPEPVARLGVAPSGGAFEARVGASQEFIDSEKKILKDNYSVIMKTILHDEDYKEWKDSLYENGRLDCSKITDEMLEYFLCEVGGEEVENRFIKRQLNERLERCRQKSEEELRRKKEEINQEHEGNIFSELTFKRKVDDSQVLDDVEKDFLKNNYLAVIRVLKASDEHKGGLYRDGWLDYNGITDEMLQYAMQHDFAYGDGRLRMRPLEEIQPEDITRVIGELRSELQVQEREVERAEEALKGWQSMMCSPYSNCFALGIGVFSFVGFAAGTGSIVALLKKMPKEDKKLFWGALRDMVNFSFKSAAGKATKFVSNNKKLLLCVGIDFVSIMGMLGVLTYYTWGLHGLLKSNGEQKQAKFRAEQLEFRINGLN